MPKIPQVQSSIQLTRQAPNRLVDAASFRVPNNTGEILSEQGKVLQAAGEQMGKVQDLAQTTSAQTEAVKRFNQIHLSAIEDPDIYNAGKKAADEIAKVKSELAPKITNQIERAKFESAFDIDAMQYTNRINQALRERQAVAATNSLIEFENGKSAEFASPDTTPYDRQMILNSLNEKYLEYVKAGVIRPEKAAAAFSEAKTRMINSYADNYTYAYPGIALEELNAGKGGMFDKLPEDKRLELKKTAQALIEKNNKENEKALNRLHNDTFNEAVKQKINGTLTPQMVKNWMDDGSLDPKSADVLLSSIISVSKKEPSDEEKATAYLSLVNRQKELSDKGNKASLQDITKLRQDAVKMNADGLLPLDKLTKVLEITDKTFTSKLNNTENTFRKKYGQSTFAAINSWADQNSPIAYRNETKARMYSDYMDRINNGETQTDALRNTIQGERKPSQYKVGDLITNPKTGISYKIIGFRDDGKELVEEIQ